MNKKEKSSFALCPAPWEHWEKPPVQLCRHRCEHLSCFIDHISTDGLLYVCETLYNLIENQCFGWEHLKLSDVITNIDMLQKSRQELLNSIKIKPEIYRFNLKVMLGLYPNIPVQQDVAAIVYSNKPTSEQNSYRRSKRIKCKSKSALINGNIICQNDLGVDTVE